jgi:septal ring factor EnvC (AmiA/AmiB activator)
MVDQPATRKDIDDIIKVIKGIAQQTSDEFVSVNDQFAKIDERFDKIDERFDKIDERFDKFEFQVNCRFDKIESDIVDLQKSHDRLLCTVDRFLARIDTYETEQIARDSQFEKLLDWARKVSVKTGIPLENL